MRYWRTFTHPPTFVLGFGAAVVCSDVLFKVLKALVVMLYRMANGTL